MRPLVPDEDVRALLDIIATSMDFGSGFLETEQVVILRRVAHYVGMDPEALTPRNMPHTFASGHKAHCGCGGCGNYQSCTKCGGPADDPRHTGWQLADDWKAPEE